MSSEVELSLSELEGHPPADRAESHQGMWSAESLDALIYAILHDQVWVRESKGEGTGYI